METKILPEFQKLLISRKLVVVEKAHFYALWVSKFLKFSNEHEGPFLPEKITGFLGQLRDAEISDWQVEQAEKAIKIYIKHFLYAREAAQNISHESCYTNCQNIVKETRSAIRLKHFSYSTERAYLDWSRRFFDYLIKIKNKNISKEVLEAEDVKDFLTHLALKRRVSASSQNQAFNALLFLFRNVINVELKDMNKTVRAKRGLKLPVVLTAEEVQEIFKNMQGNSKLMVQLLYGAGLRLMELARLRVNNVDFKSNVIFVRGGKGDKDRITMLPEMIKNSLQHHLEKVKALHKKDIESGYGEVFLPESLARKYPNAAKDWRWQYVFPSLRLSVDPRSGKVRRHHISPNAIQKFVAKAVKEAGIVKNATVHTLRHSFAIHLLMNGVNIRKIQDLLGHKNVETTMVYTHVLRDMSNAPKSPLDSLWEKH